MHLQPHREVCCTSCSCHHCTTCRVPKFLLPRQLGLVCASKMLLLIDLPVLHLGCHPFTSPSWLHLQPLNGLPPCLPSLCPTISIRPFQPFLPPLCLYVAVMPPARSICNLLPSFSLLGPRHRCGPSQDSSSSLHSLTFYIFLLSKFFYVGPIKVAAPSFVLIVA